MILLAGVCTGAVRTASSAAAVSEVQSITPLRLCRKACCIPPEWRRRWLATVVQVITIRGQLLPPRAATLHWLRQRLQRLMRESSPVDTVHRLRAAEWNSSLPHELQRLPGRS